LNSPLHWLLLALLCPLSWSSHTFNIMFGPGIKLIFVINISSMSELWWLKGWWYSSVYLTDMLKDHWEKTKKIVVVRWRRLERAT
jgi:hypothetical protein